jgi:predicted SAM-dependent methyltransferase
MARMLNVGCGDRFHSDWVNLDMNAASPEVRIADLRRGIPFPPGAFEVVYHSHVLEHLPRPKAPDMIAECHRVLKSGGLIRVVVPDLESLAREYLEILRMIDEGDQRGHRRYDWILIELFDQFVRTRPGGEMIEYLRRRDNPEADYVIGRIGPWAAPIVRGEPGAAPPGPPRQPVPVAIRLRYLLRSLRLRLTRWWPGARNFEQSGERHLWMYDRYSLSRLLEGAGFTDIQIVAHNQSRIPGWVDYHLDTDPDGRPANPGSLYLEAVKRDA